MAEVPSVVYRIPEYAALGIDGVSIGSNDLTQLMLGVDRDSEICADLFDESDAAVLDAIERIITATRDGRHHVVALRTGAVEPPRVRGTPRSVRDRLDLREPRRSARGTPRDRHRRAPCHPRLGARQSVVGRGDLKCTRPVPDRPRSHRLLPWSRRNDRLGEGAAPRCGAGDPHATSEHWEKFLVHRRVADSPEVPSWSVIAFASRREARVALGTDSAPTTLTAGPASKHEVVRELGELALVLPSLVNQALEANDRAKYYLEPVAGIRDVARPPARSSGPVIARRTTRGGNQRPNGSTRSSSRRRRAVTTAPSSCLASARSTMR